MIGKLISNLSRATPAAAPQAAAPSAPAASGLPPTFAQELLAAQSLIVQLRADPALADPKRLERHGSKTYSQNDEDGILAEIFRRIGAPHRTFVEFGCGFGLESNTACLLAQGWRGLWMDADPNNAGTIQRVFGYLIGYGLLQFRQSFIRRDNINELIASADLGAEIDLLSIDIDGNDYHVWDAIDCVSPRVVVIEYNGKFQPPHDWCVPYDPDYAWDNTDHTGASLTALTRLGEARGYQLVGCNLTGINAFFVRRDLAGDLFATPATALHLHQPPRYYLAHYFFSGHANNSYSIVEGAALGAGLPWPPDRAIDTIYSSTLGPNPG